MNNKIILGLVLLVVLVSGCVKTATQSKACTDLREGKLCPDGSYVARNPELNCEFDPCPEAKETAGDAELCGNMTFTEAQKIAKASDCIKEGGLKSSHFCNEGTGTWWIDLDIQKQGCNPACVINVDTKQAEINWRCTGLITPETIKGITIRQSGGAGLLIIQCSDREYINNTSDYIVEGTVEKAESKWNDDNSSIITYTDFSIDKYIKGTPLAENNLQIQTPGGTVGNISMAVEDQPIFHEGKKVRIYFKETDGEFSIVCGNMGVEEI